MNNELETDIKYSFKVSEITDSDYKFAVSIINWLTDNMEKLTDSDDDDLFSKVNQGYNEENIKSFGAKPVCDVYFDHTGYDSNFDHQYPETVHTIIICQLKGNNNDTYLKACELYDYILQEIIENESYRNLKGVVKDTFINNSGIQSRKKWGVIVGFELTHILYH